MTHALVPVPWCCNRPQACQPNTRALRAAPAPEIVLAGKNGGITWVTVAVCAGPEHIWIALNTSRWPNSLQRSFGMKAEPRIRSPTIERPIMPLDVRASGASTVLVWIPPVPCGLLCLVSVWTGESRIRGCRSVLASSSKASPGRVQSRRPPLGCYGNTRSQSQTVKTDRAVPNKTDEAAARFAVPYMFAKM